MVYFSGEVVLTAEEVLNEEGNPEVVIRCVALNWFHVGKKLNFSQCFGNIGGLVISLSSSLKLIDK